MVQDRRNLERMYEQRERDYQRSEAPGGVGIM